jgi:hypothetical protein
MESEMKVKYPHIEVELVNTNGNAFAVLGNVTKAMRKAGINEDERKLFMHEAMNGDYDHLLRTVMKWVNVR